MKNTQTTAVRVPRFAKKTPFSKELRNRVDAYFATGTKNATLPMVVKTIIILSGAAGAWFTLNFVSVSPVVTLVLWATLGAFVALIGLNIAHDLIHGSYFKSKRLNKIGGLLFNIIGADDREWEQSHNVDHHYHTNIHGFDQDLGGASFNVMRLSPRQPYHWIYKWQHIYVWFPLYMLGTLAWVFVKDYVRFAKRAKKMPQKEKVLGLARLLFFKSVYYTLFIGIPVMCVDAPIGYVIGGFFLMHAVESLLLVTTFMLAHVVEGNEFPVPDTNMQLKNDMFVHQLLTTTNFATGSSIVTWLTGGLNHQIEHHLFPNVCHIHYPQLRKIVWKTCIEYEVPYREVVTLGEAIRLHQRFLKKRGRGY